MSTRSNRQKAKQDAERQHTAHQAAELIESMDYQVEHALGRATPAIVAVLDNLTLSPLQGLSEAAIARARLEVANDGTVSLETLRAFADAVPVGLEPLRDARLVNKAEAAIGAPVMTARARAKRDAERQHILLGLLSPNSQPAPWKPTSLRTSTCVSAAAGGRGVGASPFQSSSRSTGRLGRSAISARAQASRWP